ncbi:MAG: hypothetical protein R3B84_19205 [Zavarzinella sp.]
MAADIHQIARWLHIASGTGGFVLGFLVACAPKFGPLGRFHRYLGRLYAICMLLMAILSIPLAYRLGSEILLIIGVLTTLAILFGWQAIRTFKSGKASLRSLRRHIILMGASYIAAWTAFLLTNPVLATGQWFDPHLHRYGPTVVGTLLISWYIRIRLPKLLQQK